MTGELQRSGVEEIFHKETRRIDEKNGRRKERAKSMLRVLILTNKGIRLRRQGED